MEYLNKIELKGVVGNVRLAAAGNRRVANFSVATNYFIRKDMGDGKSGVTVETTWHNVVAWENEDIDCIDNIEKGVHVHVCGRIRNKRYTASDGTARMTTEVLAQVVEIVREEKKKKSKKKDKDEDVEKDEWDDFGL